MNWSTYYSNFFKMLGFAFIPPLIKTFLYYVIFRAIGYSITLVICFIAAFIPFAIFRFIGFAGGAFISIALGIAAQIYVIDYLADIDNYLILIAVIGIIEIVSYTIQFWLILG
jgi:hypothetical protein